MELNSELWSQQELADLKTALDYNRPVAEIAQTLQRDVDEVAAKLNELGLIEHLEPKGKRISRKAD